MRLLIINSVCGIGSTGRICENIANEYLSFGWDVKIAYGRGLKSNKLKSISYRIGNKITFYYNVLKSRFFDNEGFNAKYQTKRFIKWANEFNPDLLWLHNLHGYYLNLNILFKWIKSRPSMEIKWTLHDCWSFTGHCSYFTSCKCDKWKYGCYACHQRDRYPKSLVDNSINNYFKKKHLFTEIPHLTLITPSIWLATLIQDSFLRDYKVEVKNNIIDHNIFYKRYEKIDDKYSLNNRKIILGVAGQWDERKGIKDFFELSKIIPKDYVIVIIGKIDKKTSKKMSSSIVHIDKTENANELAIFYSNSYVLFNPTYEDNYPTINLEAEACGLPVLAYDSGGTKETIKLRESVLIKTGDLSAACKVLNERMREQNEYFAN